MLGVTDKEAKLYRRRLKEDARLSQRSRAEGEIKMAAIAGLMTMGMPKAPAPPPVVAPPVMPTTSIADVAARDKQRALAGMAGTNLTGGLGLKAPANTTGGKKLLGS